jgi:hypothetical protein
MSNGEQQTEYEALAKQAGAVSSQPPGGTVDYAALAKQAGATDSQPKYKPGAFQRAKGAPVENINDVGAAEAARKAGTEAGEDAAASLLPGGQATLGAVKGALHTGLTLGDLGRRGLRTIPALRPYVDAPENIQSGFRDFIEPRGLGQQLGYGAEQAGEFLLPGSAEERLGMKAAELMPKLGRVAPVLGRLGAGALSTGAVNTAQGGSFGEGALLGLGSGTFTEAGRAIAPALAESALGVTKRLRGFGRTPGTAALEEIRGIRPGTVAENARAALDDLTSQLEQSAARSTVTTSTAPAVAVVDREMSKAAQRNSKTLYDQLNAVREQLTTEFSTGKALGGQLSASRLLELKRGIGELEGSWNPEQRGALKGIVRKVYKALDEELDRAVPESAQLNQRISSLIPVAQRAESTERGAEIGQRLMHRVAAHTGALLPSLAGGYYGYEKGGPLGAAAGFTLPEVLASPSGQMLGARVLRSPIPARLGRAVVPQLLGLGRKRTEE